MTNKDKDIIRLKDVFSNYPENYKNHRYGTMEGIQEQLDELGDKVGFIWYVESAKLNHNKQYYVEMGKFIVNVK
jgi:hypothetical protein